VGTTASQPADGWHEWTVAGALVESPDGLLLVRNVRRGGSEDWSTPGGVIDADDVSLLAGLAREVEEETGLRITQWHGPVYEVVAEAPDMGWRMRCEVHHAAAFEGEIVIDDPDGIVVEAAFVVHDLISAHLERCPPWVSEPLSSWIAERWSAHDPTRTFRYDVHGSSRDDLRVVRRDG
jgi:8-oxo-dGTP pyrophosphatase MutT (NUDIX family)